MCSTAEQVFEDASKIPTLALGSSQLLTKLMDDDLGVRDVLEEVERFAVIVAKLISLANSAWSNPVTAVTSLDAACTRLGLNVVRTVTIALAVGRSFNLSHCPAFDRTRYWTGSIVTSEIAAALAPQFQAHAPTARTVGLLHNVGLLLLAESFPDQTNKALREAAADVGISVDGHLKQSCGIGYWEAGVFLLRYWQLPEILSHGLGGRMNLEGVEPHHQMRVLIGVSARIASLVCSGDAQLDLPSDLEAEPALRKVFYEQQQKFAETLDMAETLFG